MNPEWIWTGAEVTVPSGAKFQVLPYRKDRVGLYIVAPQVVFTAWPLSWDNFAFATSVGSESFLITDLLYPSFSQQIWNVFHLLGSDATFFVCEATGRVVAEKAEKQSAKNIRVKVRRR